MAIKVRINPNQGKPNKVVVRPVGQTNIVSPNYDISRSVSLVGLNDVDASDVDNNETLVYDEATSKFIIKTIPIIQGGTF